MQLNFNMSTFALKKLKEVVVNSVLTNLLVDDVCPFDEFEKEMSKQYKSEVITMYAYMDQVANETLAFAWYEIPSVW